MNGTDTEQIQNANGMDTEQIQNGYENGNGTDTEQIQNANGMDTEWIQNGYRMNTEGRWNRYRTVTNHQNGKKAFSRTHVSKLCYQSAYQGSGNDVTLNTCSSNFCPAWQS